MFKNVRLSPEEKDLIIAIDTKKYSFVEMMGLFQESKLFSKFMQYLKTIQSVESLELWRQLQNPPQENLIDFLAEITRDYLDPNAATCVNVEYSLRRDIMDALEKPTEPEKLSQLVISLSKGSSNVLNTHIREFISDIEQQLSEEPLVFPPSLISTSPESERKEGKKLKERSLGSLKRNATTGEIGRSSPTKIDASNNLAVESPKKNSKFSKFKAKFKKRLSIDRSDTDSGNLEKMEERRYRKASLGWDTKTTILNSGDVLESRLADVAISPEYTPVKRKIGKVTILTPDESPPSSDSSGNTSPRIKPPVSLRKRSTEVTPSLHMALFTKVTSSVFLVARAHFLSI